MGQRQICSGGSTGQGVIRRINSTRAREQGTEAGQPPDRHSRMAQSMGYDCAFKLEGSEMPVNARAKTNGKSRILRKTLMLGSLAGDSQHTYNNILMQR